jgi:DNA-binding transcriptional regulator YiaG
MTAEELRRRRERLGLSVGELAREFDVENSTLYRWESSDGPPRGLTALGADVVLKRLERLKQKGEL